MKHRGQRGDHTAIIIVHEAVVARREVKRVREEPMPFAVRGRSTETNQSQ